MKKILMTALLCGIMMTVWGCGSQAEEAASTVETTTETVETSSAEEASTEADLEETVLENVTGIVTDISVSGVMIQAEDGSFYLFSEDDATKVNCAEGVLIGAIVDVTYTGTQETGDAVAVEISDSDVTAKADREALEFAIMVIETMQFMDQEGLSKMMTYPTYVGVGEIDETIDDADALTALDRETLFAEQLLIAISEYNLFDLEETGAGFVLGDGTPNVIFRADENSEYHFGITGING